MCGRFVVTSPTIDLVSLFDVRFVGEDLPQPSWNVAPTQQVPVIIDAADRTARASEPLRRLESARWGLVPSWAKDLSIGARAFNARIETAAEKPMFRSPVASHRAVIPATGYYEWHTTAAGKAPKFIHPAGGEIISFAALYSWWRVPTVAPDSDDAWLLSAAILTRASAGPLSGIHDRMPVFLSAALIDEWLDPRERGSAQLLDAVASSAIGVALTMTHYEVDRAVGSVRNNSASLIEPSGTAPDGGLPASG